MNNYNHNIRFITFQVKKNQIYNFKIIFLHNNLISWNYLINIIMNKNKLLKDNIYYFQIKINKKIILIIYIR